MKSTAMLAAGLLAVCPGFAQTADRERERDQRREDELRRSGPRIIVFESANYRGDARVLLAGEGIDNLDSVPFEGGRRANDRISSVRIEGSAVLLAYEHADFRGAVIRVTESIPNLADRAMPDGGVSWNDRISSLRVDVRPLRARPVADPDRVIRRAFLDLLRREPNAEEARYHRGLILDQGWTDEMIRERLRESGELRRQEADRIITRSYRDLLGRDPDPEGLNTYRKLLMERGGTEQQLRDILRRSQEYRNRPMAPTDGNRAGTPESNR